MTNPEQLQIFRFFLAKECPEDMLVFELNEDLSKLLKSIIALERPTRSRAQLEKLRKNTEQAVEKIMSKYVNGPSKL